MIDLNASLIKGPVTRYRIRLSAQHRILPFREPYAIIWQNKMKIVKGGNFMGGLYSWAAYVHVVSSESGTGSLIHKVQGSLILEAFKFVLPVLDLSSGIDIATIDATQDTNSPTMVLFFRPNLSNNINDR